MSIPVVICFRNLYLWYSDTTRTTSTWNFICCDLLSKFISLIFWYNNKAVQKIKAQVVICFRNLYLWYSDTTAIQRWQNSSQLWFAFEIYIFDILIQHRTYFIRLPICCDLLSKFISLIFWYNRTSDTSTTKQVVICFRNLYLWYSDTTFGNRESGWKCCDLLSKFISLIFWYNFIYMVQTNRRVVICFRNLYLWYSDTTLFKIFRCRFGCDLLSKFISLIFWYNLSVAIEMFIRLWFAFEIYIFDILIQRGITTISEETVVICFRNLYLWYSDTTCMEIVSIYISCDLLSKFISLIFWYNNYPRICQS